MTTISAMRQGFADDFQGAMGHSIDPTVAYGDIPSGSLLENDTDENGDPIGASERVRAVLETYPSTGTVDIWTIAGELQWTPGTTPDSLVYRLYVEGVGAGTATVTLDTNQGGSESSVSVVSSGAGTKKATGGAAASVDVVAAGGGTADNIEDYAGGAISTVEVAPVGAGTKHADNGSVATVNVVPQGFTSAGPDPALMLPSKDKVPRLVPGR